MYGVPYDVLVHLCICVSSVGNVWLNYWQFSVDFFFDYWMIRIPYVICILTSCQDIVCKCFLLFCELFPFGFLCFPRVLCLFYTGSCIFRIWSMKYLFISMFILFVSLFSSSRFIHIFTSRSLFNFEFIQA